MRAEGDGVLESEFRRHAGEIHIGDHHGEGGIEEVVGRDLRRCRVREGAFVVGGAEEPGGGTVYCLRLEKGEGEGCLLYTFGAARLNTC